MQNRVVRSSKVVKPVSYQNKLGDPGIGSSEVWNTSTGAITALTGDVTASGPGSAAATISNGAVTLAKMDNLAANSIVGNNTGSAATPIALTVAQVNTLLGTTPHTYARITGSDVTTSSTSLVDITGLSVALAANSVYEMEAHVLALSSTTDQNEYGVNYSAAGASIDGTIRGYLFADTHVGSGEITAFNTATGPLQYTSKGFLDFYCLVTTGANTGNLTIQHLKVTSGTATAYVNSYMKVTKVA